MSSVLYNQNKIQIKKWMLRQMQDLTRRQINEVYTHVEEPTKVPWECDVSLLLNKDN